MNANEVILSKKVRIERCTEQILNYYRCNYGIPFERDHLRQDGISMNLERACELTIDIANYLVRKKKLGLPRESRESFALLEQAGLISAEQMKKLQSLIGFRNTLVHDYQQIDLVMMVKVIESDLPILLEFANMALESVD